MKTLTLNINGKDIVVAAEARENVADILRERLSLTGTHLGCEHGACGACTIMVDGKATRACLILGVMAEGRRIVTIEGMRDDRMTELLRKHFHSEHALQCGFCTPGMLIMAREILVNATKKGAPMQEKDVREAMAGQICRCTGYSGIVRAILAAAKEISASRRVHLGG